MDPQKSFHLPSSEATEKATGKSWADWIHVLDQKEAFLLDHKGIVKLLKSEIGNPWWQQMVTVGYEQLKGLRVKHQKSSGFEISLSKTYSIPLELAWKRMESLPALQPWAGEGWIPFGKTKERTKIQFDHTDGSRVELSLSSAHPSKSTLRVQHRKISSDAKAQEWKVFWKNAFSHFSTLTD